MRNKDFPSKYYPVDVGLRNARLNFRQVEVTHLMECAIFNELIARGANVDVGMLEVESRKGGVRQKKQYEIDFIVNLGHEKVYIQSAYKLPTPEKKEQEVRGLKKIGDAFRKLVIVDGVQPLYTDEFGIFRSVGKTMDLRRFDFEEWVLERRCLAAYADRKKILMCL